MSQDEETHQQTTLLQLLIRAAEEGSAESITKLISNGAAVNGCIDDWSPLQMAAYHGQLEAVRLIVEAGGDHSKRRVNGGTPFYLAAENGHIKVAKYLQSKGANINCAKDGGWVPIHIAAHFGHPEVAQFLLNKGAELDLKPPLVPEEVPKVNAKNETGWTPLHSAARVEGNLELVKLLVEFGADTEVLDDLGQSPKDVVSQEDPNGVAEYLEEIEAASTLHASTKLGAYFKVEQMLDQGAQADKTDPKGNTAQHYAQENNHYRLVQLLKKRTQQQKLDRDLHEAAVLQTDEGIGQLKSLLSKGANVQNIARGWTPLKRAVQRNNIQAVKILLQNGADVNQGGPSGYTPLYLASQLGHLEQVKLLVEKGAKVNAEDKDGITPLYQASMHGQPLVIQELVKHGADVNKQRLQGHCPLYAAAQNNQPQAIKVLLENNANVMIKSNEGFTALHGAAESGYMEIVKLLLSAGADVADQNLKGYSPLHLAAQEGRMPVLQELIRNQAPVNLKSHDGLTPLHLSCKYGKSILIVKELLSHGADPNIETAKGKKPQDVVPAKDKYGIRAHMESVQQCKDIVEAAHLHARLKVEALVRDGQSVNLGTQTSRSALDMVKSNETVILMEYVRNANPKEDETPPEESVKKGKNKSDQRAEVDPHADAASDDAYKQANNGKDPDGSDGRSQPNRQSYTGNTTSSNRGGKSSRGGRATSTTSTKKSRGQKGGDQGDQVVTTDSIRGKGKKGARKGTVSLPDSTKTRLLSDVMHDDFAIPAPVLHTEQDTVGAKRTSRESDQIDKVKGAKQAKRGRGKSSKKTAGKHDQLDSAGHEVIPFKPPEIELKDTLEQDCQVQWKPGYAILKSTFSMTGSATTRSPFNFQDILQIPDHEDNIDRTKTFVINITSSSEVNSYLGQSIESVVLEDFMSSIDTKQDQYKQTTSRNLLLYFERTVAMKTRSVDMRALRQLSLSPVAKDKLKQSGKTGFEAAYGDGLISGSVEGVKFQALLHVKVVNSKSIPEALKVVEKDLVMRPKELMQRGTPRGGLNDQGWGLVRAWTSETGVCELQEVLQKLMGMRDYPMKKLEAVITPYSVLDLEDL